MYLSAQDEGVYSNSPETSNSFRPSALLHLDENIEPDSLEWAQATSRVGLPLSVGWKLTLNADGSKTSVPIEPQMSTDKNLPQTNKCDSRSIRAGISRPREARPQSIMSTGKSKWTSQIRMQQLLPSKARAGSVNVEPARGTTRLHSS